MPSSTERVVAIDVGGTGLKGAVFDERGRVHEAAVKPTPVADGPDAVVDAIRELAGGLLTRAPDARAVGVAVPGVVVESTGTVRTAANLGWEDVPIGPLLAEALGREVVVCHDVRAAALAEGVLGAARDARDYLLLTLGTGVGAAVVLDGRPYTGARGLGGELGHTVVDPGGTRCACGARGCLEIYASAGGLARRYSELGGGSVSALEVGRRAASGEAVAARVWRQALEALALALANYVTLLDPELVVIGGGMAGAGEERLFGPLGELLDQRLTLGAPPPVVPARLGEDAGRCGAAIAAWQATDIGQTALASWAT